MSRRQKPSHMNFQTPCLQSLFSPPTAAVIKFWWHYVDYSSQRDYRLSKQVGGFATWRNFVIVFMSVYFQIGWSQNRQAILTNAQIIIIKRDKRLSFADLHRSNFRRQCLLLHFENRRLWSGGLAWTHFHPTFFFSWTLSKEQCRNLWNNGMKAPNLHQTPSRKLITEMTLPVRIGRTN